MLYIDDKKQKCLTHHNQHSYFKNDDQMSLMKQLFHVFWIGGKIKQELSIQIGLMSQRNVWPPKCIKTCNTFVARNSSKA